MAKKEQPNVITDPVLLEKAGQIVKKKEKKVKKIKATKDLITKRKNALYPIPIDIDETEDEIVTMEFQAKRLTPKEYSEIVDLGIDTSVPELLSDEEKEKLNNQGYELLAKAVVDPVYNSEEWKELDIALTQELVTKVTLLQTQANDGKLVEDFRVLSKRMTNSS